MKEAINADLWNQELGFPVMRGVPSPAFSFTLSVRQVYKSSFSMFCSHLFSCSSWRKNLEISSRADKRLLLIKNI